jgi:DNA-binding LacI/PurR family transcriptional regulator
MIDRYYGFRVLLDHIRQSGHTKVGLLVYSTLPEIVLYGSAGYVRVAQEAGFDEFSDENVIVIRNEQVTVSEVDYETPIHEMLQRDNTAIIGYDEVITIRLMFKAAHLGIQIPKNLSIASLVDMTPNVHTIRLTKLNCAELLSTCAKRAGELVYRRISGEDISGQSIIMTPAIVCGDSVTDAKTTVGHDP